MVPLVRCAAPRGMSESDATPNPREGKEREEGRGSCWTRTGDPIAYRGAQHEASDFSSRRVAARNDPKCSIAGSIWPTTSIFILSMLTLLTVLLLAYLVGSIPFGLLLSRLKGIDIRQHGSGNIGATNVWRTLGPKWGLPTFLLDAAKGGLAVWAGRELAFTLAPKPVPYEYLNYAEVFAGLVAILGHSFPVWLRFRGGKGVATSLGVMLGIIPLMASGIVFATWVIVFALSRYVSLASLVAAVSLPLTLVVLQANHLLEGRATLAFGCAAAFFVIRRHRENIQRLLAGTENRFGKSKPQP
jgi:glycerol-3-phosphate acyltransferase PlsY